MGEREDHFNLESGWPPWKDEPSEAARTPSSRIAWAAADAAMVLFGVLMTSLGALVIALPYLILEGLDKWKGDVLAFDFCVGCLFIGVGSLLIWCRR